MRVALILAGVTAVRAAGEALGAPPVVSAPLAVANFVAVLLVLSDLWPKELSSLRRFVASRLSRSSSRPAS